MITLALYQILLLWAFSGVIGCIIVWWLDDMQYDITLSHIVWAAICGGVVLFCALVGLVYTTFSCKIVVFKRKI